MRNQGFVRVYFPTYAVVNRALKGFTNFLAEPLEYRKSWTIECGGDKESEAGYLSRDKPINKMTGYAYDHKDVFHFQPGLFRKLIERNVSCGKYKDWLAVLKRLYYEILGVANMVKDELLSSYPNARPCSVLEDGHVLRLLHYHMKEREGGVIGAGHTDESFITVHIADNFPGLKAGKKGGTSLVTMTRDILFIYPGKQAEQATRGEIRALWHEIVDTRPEIQYFEEPGKSGSDRISDTHRVAAVFFFDLGLHKKM
jgi:hypothetical protein